MLYFANKGRKIINQRKYSNGCVSVLMMIGCKGNAKDSKRKYLPLMKVNKAKKKIRAHILEQFYYIYK